MVHNEESDLIFIYHCPTEVLGIVRPKVSIIWLNYNSMEFINIVKESLLALNDLDYDNYEVIIVDNASTDGSYEIVKSIAEKLHVKKKVIRNERNLGFTGGCNVGYQARDPDSKYIVLLNNDAIPFSDSLRNLVEYITSFENVGAAQGIILDMQSRKVDTAGDFLDEMVLTHQLLHSKDPSTLKKPITISYADGAYAIFDVDAVKRATGFPNKIFYDELFAYFDDSVLGIQLWNSGYKVISCPFIAALHRRSSTFKQFLHKQLYYMVRGYYALVEITNTRLKKIIRSQIVFKVIASVLQAMFYRLRGNRIPSITAIASAVYRGYVDGIAWGKKWLRNHSKPLDIYKVPIVTLNPRIVALTQLGIGSAIRKRYYVKHIDDILMRNLSSYYLE